MLSFAGDERHRRKDNAMFRMSGTLYKDGRILRDCVSRQEDYSVSRTEHVFTALREICSYLDLENPIWLEQNIRQFKMKSKTQFYQDSFVERIHFDYLAIEVISE